MARPKKVIEDELEDFSELIETPKILPITQNFSNEELHILRDKINELIANS